jgi:hypothetical protein
MFNANGGALSTDPNVDPSRLVSFDEVIEDWIAASNTLPNYFGLSVQLRKGVPVFLNSGGGGWCQLFLEELSAEQVAG